MRLDMLYDKYSEKNIQHWCLTLKHFRLTTMHPYPDDLHPDRFLSMIKFSNEEELENILSQLELTTSTTKPEISRYQEHNPNHFAGWILVNNVLCYLNVNKILKNILVEVSGNTEDQFTLDSSTIERAIKIDEYIDSLNLVFQDPPQDDDYCISPKYHPRLWK